MPASSQLTSPISCCYLMCEPLLQLHCSSFVSSARNKLWWMTPHWGSQAQDILPGALHVSYVVAKNRPKLCMFLLDQKQRVHK